MADRQMIKPEDIQAKEFSIGKKGYVEEEVDGFLDELTADMVELLRENAFLQQKVATLTSDMQSIKSSESSILHTVNSAKLLMEEISASADKHAEIIIRNANLEAESIVKEARSSVEEITQSARLLKKQWSYFKTRYKAMLQDEINRFDNIELGDLYEELNYVDHTQKDPLSFTPTPKHTRKKTDTNL